MVHAESRAKLDPMSLAIALLCEEAREPALGAETLVHALLDVIFTYLLRQVVEQRGLSGTSFCQAVRAPHIRRAVEKAVGLPPREFRRRDAADRASPFRA